MTCEYCEKPQVEICVRRGVGVCDDHRDLDFFGERARPAPEDPGLVVYRLTWLGQQIFDGRKGDIYDGF